jgi:hypothetical protein
MAMEMAADLIRNWSFMNGDAAEPRSAEPRRSLLVSCARLAKSFPSR